MKKYILTLLISSLMITNSFAAGVEAAASAAAPAATEAASTATTAAAETGGFAQYKKLFDSPMGVIIVAGIAAVYSGVLYKAAAKQEEDSKANVEKIDKIIASVKNSFAAFCPNGRENLAEPKCYCYSADGTQNATRSKSQICIDLWAQSNYKIDGTEGNYSLAAYNPDVAGCVAVDGQFDETCKCKKMLDSKGNNACKKETSVSLPASNFASGFGTDSGYQQLLKFSANASNGNPRFDLMGSSLKANAIKAGGISDQILSKLPLADKDMKVPHIDESNVGKYARAVIGDRALSSAMGSGMAMNVASERSDNPAMNNLLKQAQAKAGIDIDGSGKGLNTKKAGKKSGFSLDLSGGESSASAGQVLEGFPTEKNYKYKNSDIVTDNSTSLFEIISNRYVQSGLKRLFDDEPKKEGK